jgi:hypothetical protein
MKKLQTLIVALLFFFSFTGNTQVFHLANKFNNHLEMNNLNEKVKSVKEYRYKLTYNADDTVKPKKVLDMYFITYYNKYGNIIKSTQYRKDASVCRLEEYTYDNKNRVILYRDSFSDKPNTGMQTTIQYNKAGNRTNETTISIPNNQILATKTYNYNSKNQLATMTMHIDYGNETDQTFYTYDSVNNIIESRQKTTGGENISKISYFPKSKLVSEIASSSFSEAYYFSYTYDKYKNVISYTKHLGKEKIYSGDELTEYEYDKFNNWIVSKNFIVSQEGVKYKSDSRKEREMEYY